MNRINSTFLIRPMDPVYFGPPRSFSAGENHRGKSVFPPSPNTFQGLVRSRLLQAVSPPLDLQDWSESSRQERESLVGGPDGLPGDWSLKGPFPGIFHKISRDYLEEPLFEPWVQTPNFLFRSANKDESPPLIATPISSTHPAMNDLGHKQILFGDPRREFLKPLGGWIGPDNLYFALTGKGKWISEQHSKEYPPFVSLEPSPGVAIDKNTGAAAHSLLYFLETLRFQSGSGLMGSFTGTVADSIPPDALVSGVGTAGRKGRLVAFEPVKHIHGKWQKIMEGEHLPDAVDENARFWLINLTPAQLDEPCTPFLNLPPTAGNATVEILASLTGKPICLGGYAMATGKSRANRTYVPPGSAWWIRIKGGKDDEDRALFLKSLNNANILINNKEASFGFGHCIVGLSKITEE